MPATETRARRDGAGGVAGWAGAADRRCDPEPGAPGAVTRNQGAPGPAAAPESPAPAQTAVIELRVRNHPGTMSHVTGLFARRAFNLEAIVCAPLGDGATSRMLLLVADEPRLEQVEHQLVKLHDVLELRHRPDLDAAYFAKLV